MTRPFPLHLATLALPHRFPNLTTYSVDTFSSAPKPPAKASCQSTPNNPRRGRIVTAAMDQDVIAFITIMFCFIACPFLVVIFITSSMAYHRTKLWQKTLSSQFEASLLNPAGSDNDSEFYDTEDEEENAKRKAEAQAERYLTFHQKFRKEFGKLWKGKGREQVEKDRAREERRKLAKAVAKELARRARREAKKDAKLPLYQKM